MKNTKTVAIIGAGIAGVTAAYYLAKQGYEVVVYEADQYPAMQCSRANGAQISVSNSETWHTWSNVYKGLKWMLKGDAPLLIKPSLDPEKIKWLTKFLWHTARGSYKENTIKTIALGLQSRVLYKQIVEEEKLNFSFNECGILHIYKDEKYFNAAKSAAEIYEDNGCEWRILTPGQVQAIEPTLYNCNGIVGGVYTKNDMVGDIHQFCVELAEVCTKKYGVIFRYGCTVDDSKLDNLRDLYDIVVVSAGAESSRLAGLLGDSCSIYPVKGYSITIDAGNDGYRIPNTSILDDQAKIVCAKLGNRIRIAGTAELGGWNYDIRMDRIKPLVSWVRENFPQIPSKDWNSWACLRPMTPDMLPLITRSRVPGIYYHTGHGHLGWTLSPATANMLVDLIDNDNK